MRSFLLFLFIATNAASQGQDLTGIWRGSFNQSNYLREPGGSRYKFEVQIDQDQALFKAVTYSYLSTIFYGKATAKGTVSLKTKKVYLEELKIVEVRMSGFSSACIMTCFLQYSKEGKEEFLEGTYYSMNTQDSSNCGKGTVFLRRVNNSDFYKEPFLVKKEKEKENPQNGSNKNEPRESNSSAQKTKSPSEVASTPLPRRSPTNNSSIPQKKNGEDTSLRAVNNSKLSEDLPSAIGAGDMKNDPQKEMAESEQEENSRLGKLKNRVNELAKTIRTTESTLEIRLYDNGTIDNDTISVYLNNRLVINKQRLTDRPIQFNIDFDKDTEILELTLFADNLGEVPPNTSLMIIKDGSKVHEVRLSSNDSKNAVVRFKRD